MILLTVHVLPVIGSDTHFKILSAFTKLVKNSDKAVTVIDFVIIKILEVKIYQFIRLVFFSYRIYVIADPSLRNVIHILRGMNPFRSI